MSRDNGTFSEDLFTDKNGKNRRLRGVAAGTYYFRITLTAAVGVMKARWEERTP